MLNVQELVNDNLEKISLTWIAGEGAATRPIANDGVPSADLVGHLNLIHPARIQVFGRQELAYYDRFEIRRRLQSLEDLVSGGTPAIIMAENLKPPQDLLEFCQQHDIPLLGSPQTAAQTIDVLRFYLSKRLAPSTTVHGVFLDVLGLGVLIQGESAHR